MKATGAPTSPFRSAPTWATRPARCAGRSPRSTTKRGVALVAVSRFYRTPPWGKTDQDWFVNACALARTDLPPFALLDRIKAIEAALGRTPSERWGPRVIDIDIIAYDDIAIESDRLTLPHPEVFNRAFVLVPLAEIAPGRVVGERRVGEAAAKLGAEAESVVPLD